MWDSNIFVGDTTSYHYAGGFKPMNEVHGSDVKTYIGGLAEAKGTSSSIGTYSYYANDHLGSTRGTYNDSQTLQAKLEYDPFGGAYTTQGAADITRRFTGHTLDPLSGFYVTPFRAYNPGTGRWMQPDPLGMVNGPNMYGYVGGNPLKFKDPFGLDAVDQIDAIGLNEIGPPNQVGLGGYGTKHGLDQGAEIADSAEKKGQVVVAVAATEVAGGPITRLLGWLGRGLLSFGRGIGEAIGLAKPASAGINICERGLQHVLERHAFGGARSAGKSIFSQGEDIAKLIRAAESVSPAKQAAGNFERIVDAGRIIGVDRATGMQTSVYTVITDGNGALVTAFPGIP